MVNRRKRHVRHSCKSLRRVPVLPSKKLLPPDPEQTAYDSDFGLRQLEDGQLAHICPNGVLRELLDRRVGLLVAKGAQQSSVVGEWNRASDFKSKTSTQIQLERQCRLFLRQREGEINDMCRVEGVVLEKAKGGIERITDLVCKPAGQIRIDPQDNTTTRTLDQADERSNRGEQDSFGGKTFASGWQRLRDVHRLTVHPMLWPIALFCNEVATLSACE